MNEPSLVQPQASLEHPAADSTRKGLPTWIILLAFALLAGFLAFIALGLRRVQEGPIAIGQKVPSFELTLFDGGTINTADLQGKVLVVNFWASWCKPCEQEAAELEAAWQTYRPSGEVVFLGVDYVDTEPEARAYLEKFKITYPNGPDLRTEISQMFRMRGVPETYVIDQDGILTSKKIGPYTSVEEIYAAIDPLLD